MMMLKKKIALLTALALLLAALGAAALADGQIVFTLDALETGGAVSRLVDYPSLDVREEITLYDDGMFWVDYRFNGEETNSMGTWRETKTGFVLELDNGSTWTLTLDKSGYYILPGSGLNMLFVREDATTTAATADWDLTMAPAAVARLTAPFKGVIDEHADAIDYVSGLLNGVTIDWMDDVKVSSAFNCARFVFNDAAEVHIVYDAVDGSVLAYACKLAYSARDSVETRLRNWQTGNWMRIPALAAMVIDSDYDETAFLQKLYSYDWDEETAAYQTALRQTFQRGAAATDYFGYQLTLMDESDGGANSVWMVLHNPAGGGAMLPQLTATPKPTATLKPTRTPKPTATPRPTRTPKPTATPRPTPTPRPTEQPLTAGNWLCAQCGTLNSLNFCTQCGAPRPENKCPSCGTEYDPANKPNFCPECGQKLKGNAR